MYTKKQNVKVVFDSRGRIESGGNRGVSRFCSRNVVRVPASISWHTGWVLERGRAEKPLFARTIYVEVVEPGEVRACPVAWLDSYS